MHQMSPDAERLMELRERGHFDGDDALEICGRCWSRADRAIRELQYRGLIQRANHARRRKTRWKFIEVAGEPQGGGD